MPRIHCSCVCRGATENESQGLIGQLRPTGLSGAKEKGDVVWDFTGQEDDSLGYV